MKRRGSESVSSRPNNPKRAKERRKWWESKSQSFHTILRQYLYCLRTSLSRTSNNPLLIPSAMTPPSPFHVYMLFWFDLTLRHFFRIFFLTFARALRSSTSSSSSPLSDFYFPFSPIICQNRTELFLFDFLLERESELIDHSSSITSIFVLFRRRAAGTHGPIHTKVAQYWGFWWEVTLSLRCCILITIVRLFVIAPQHQSPFLLPMQSRRKQHKKLDNRVVDGVPLSFT